MRPLAFVIMALIPTFAVADMISVSVPSAVREAVDGYRAECTDEGGELQLDGDEISKLWTDEGEEAYVIHAAFTCGDLGHLWCGAMGHCPTDLVINNKFYNTNRILQKHPNRISKGSDGAVTYWMPDGLKLMIDR
jgi:hypothetical protein